MTNGKLTQSRRQEQFGAAVAAWSAVPPEDGLARIHGWLLRNEPFCHFRMNDGEFNCMLRLYPANTRNNCGHHYFTDLGDGLLRVLHEAHALASQVTVPAGGGPTAAVPPNLLIGSYWMTQGGKLTDLDATGLAAVNWLMERGMLDALPWAASDLVPWATHTGLCVDVCKVLRDRGDVVLVGNVGIERARHCLGAEFYGIDRFDCWRNTETIVGRCRARLRGNRRTAFVWCAGMSKPWIWDLWREFPESSHIDFGHGFDGVFGDYNRAWLRRRDPAEKRWVEFGTRFVPFVKSHIP